MALFQKKPIVESSSPFYTLGLETNLLIVGLGNIGDEFDHTRHNIGFEIIDEFARKNDFAKWHNKSDLKSLISVHKLGSTRVILAKPTTLMNLSGEAVRAVQDFYKIDNSKTLVIHDELDIEFGSIRMRSGGKAAGHNGIKSIIQHCDENFDRIRIGIGPKTPKQIDSADFVLKRFSPKQKDQMKNLLTESTSIVSEYVYSGGKLPQETRSFIF